MLGEDPATLAPETSEPVDAFTHLYGLLKPDHHESFASTFGVDIREEAHRIAAETELRLRVALELNDKRYLSGMNGLLAIRLDQCRRGQNSPHACRELLYKGPHAECWHAPPS